MANWRAWSAQRDRQDEWDKRKKDVAQSLMEAVQSNPHWGEAEIRNAASMLSGGSLPEYGHLVSGNMIEGFAESNRKEFDRKEKIRLEKQAYDRKQDSISNIVNFQNMEDRAFNRAVGAFSDEEILSVDPQTAWNNYNSTFDPRYQEAGATKLTLDQFSQKFAAAQHAARQRLQDKKDADAEKNRRIRSDNNTQLGAARTSFVDQFTPQQLQEGLANGTLWNDYQGYLGALGITPPAGPGPMRAAARSRLNTAKQAWQQKAIEAREAAFEQAASDPYFFNRPPHLALQDLHAIERRYRGDFAGPEDEFPLITVQEIQGRFQAAEQKQRDQFAKDHERLKPLVQDRVNTFIPQHQADNLSDMATMQGIEQQIIGSFNEADREVVAQILAENPISARAGGYWMGWLDQNRNTLTESAGRFTDEGEFFDSLGNHYTNADKKTKTAIQSIWDNQQNQRNLTFKGGVNKSITGYLEETSQDAAYLARLYADRNSPTGKANWDEAIENIIMTMNGLYPNMKVTGDDISNAIKGRATTARISSLQENIDTLTEVLSNEVDKNADSAVEAIKSISLLDGDEFAQATLAALYKMGVTDTSTLSRAAVVYKALEDEEPKEWESLTADLRALMVSERMGGISGPGVNKTFQKLADARSALKWTQRPSEWEKFVEADLKHVTETLAEVQDGMNFQDISSATTREIELAIKNYETVLQGAVERRDELKKNILDMSPWVGEASVNFVSDLERRMSAAISKNSQRGKESVARLKEELSRRAQVRAQAKDIQGRFQHGTLIDAIKPEVIREISLAAAQANRDGDARSANDLRQIMGTLLWGGEITDAQYAMIKSIVETVYANKAPAQ